MTSGRNATRKVLTGLLLAGVGMAITPAPALAQQDDARLRRIEAELRALQRTVFPGDGGRYFAPEVDTSQAQPQQPAGTAANSTLTAVLARLDALEAQLAGLTARSEENANELSLLRAKIDAAAAAAAPPPIEVATIAPAPAPTLTASPAPPPALAPARAGTPAATAALAPSAERVAAVRAILKPQTDDAGDDEYTYGYRLWEAGYFPEAQQQLAL